MNQVGHHNIIEKFTKGQGITDKREILLQASDYTDSIWRYIYYNFNYEICRTNESNVLEIIRAKNDNIKLLPDIEADAFSLGFPEQHPKDFFAVINRRKESTVIDEFLGNQDDNVSFLHAMGADGEEGSINIFKRHLERCFSEYLFLKDENKALFMLGIAFHGIMDSFTPSHTDFQKFAEQNMAFHAQGDVIPIEGIDKELHFDPGQVKNDLASKEEKIAGIAIKGFDGDDILNPTEEVMLFLYLYLSNIQDKETKKELSLDEIDSLVVNKLEGKSISDINSYIKTYYEYGRDAYIFSHSTLRVLDAVWCNLSTCRKEMTSYERYCSEETRKVIQNAIDIWEKNYNKFINKISRNNKLAILKSYFSYNSWGWQKLQGIFGFNYSIKKRAAQQYDKIANTLNQSWTIAKYTAEELGKDIVKGLNNSPNRLM